MVAKLWHITYKMIGWEGLVSLWGSCRTQTVACPTPPKDEANFDRGI